MLERGVIPPQALFEKLNPNIDAASHNVKVCVCVCVPKITLDSVFGYQLSDSSADKNPFCSRFLRKSLPGLDQACAGSLPTPLGSAVPTPTSYSMTL